MVKRMIALVILCAAIAIAPGWSEKTPRINAGCVATSCRVVPCSRTMSTDNGVHTPDDAIGPAQRMMPEGCDENTVPVP